jgi:hypothetical protein
MNPESFNPISLLGSSAGSEVRRTGTLRTDPYFINGILYVDVLTTNAKGQPLIVKEVKLQEQRRGIIAPIQAGTKVEIRFATQDAYQREDGTLCIASTAELSPQTSNQAIPANLLTKIDGKSLLKGANNVCLGMKQAFKDLKDRAAKLHEKDSLIVFQHPVGDRSSGVAISNAKDGVLSIFDRTGKNKTNIHDGGMDINVKDLDTKDSTRTRSHALFGGLPSQETFVADFVPKSNIFTPTPTHIPHITKIVTIIGMARAVITVGKIASEGLKEIRRLKAELDAVPDYPERSYYSDKDRVKKLNQTKRMSALTPLLQEQGIISERSASDLNQLIKFEQSELNKRGSTKEPRNRAFERIAQESGKRAKDMIDSYTKEGGKGERELDNLNFLGSINPAKMAPQNPSRSRPPFRGTGTETVIEGPTPGDRNS